MAEAGKFEVKIDFANIPALVEQFEKIEARLVAMAVRLEALEKVAAKPDENGSLTSVYEQNMLIFDKEAKVERDFPRRGW